MCLIRISREQHKRLKLLTVKEDMPNFDVMIKELIDMWECLP